MPDTARSTAIVLVNSVPTALPARINGSSNGLPIAREVMEGGFDCEYT